MKARKWVLGQHFEGPADAACIQEQEEELPELQLGVIEMKARKWVLGQHFEGPADAACIQEQEEELPELQPGDVLCVAEYWSVDPHVRPMSDFLQIGDTIVSTQLSRVVESRNANWPVGCRFVGGFGWRTHTVLNPDEVGTDPMYGPPKVTRLPYVLNGLPPLRALGLLGHPGATAHVAVKEILRPKPGDVVYIGSAAGAVGHIAGQIAKIMGCTVIGSTSRQDKCKWLLDHVRLDHAFNYQKVDVSQELKRLAPNGIDAFLDTVGSHVTCDIVQNNMKHKGVICCCGCISSYNNVQNQPSGVLPWGYIMAKELRVQGIIINSYHDKFDEIFTELAQWTKEGSLIYKEDISHGFSSLPQKFLSVMNGENKGKAIVAAND